MTAPGSTFISIRIMCLAFAVALPTLKGAAQEKPQYTREEYQAYEAVANEADALKKIDLAIAFLQERAQSTLRPHAVAAYQSAMAELQGSAQWGEMITAGERYLELVPDDIYTVSMLATAYQQTQQLEKFVVAGEKVFAEDPSRGNTAYYLTKAYLDLKNNAKFLEWGEKTVSLLPDNHEILLELTKKHDASGHDSKASKYASLCIKAVRSAEKPEVVPAAQWRQYRTHVYATCYYVVGKYAHDRQSYKSAIANLENATKYFRKNEHAYYFLAQSYWQQGRIDLAMKNFAKAFVIGGSTARSSKQHLDNLYRSLNQQSTEGIERVINKARAELK